eukprot:TRINITY_DN7152_c0_g1_i1.p1 TRINITY_DN7152_c0_g1~~TRINITY_DN7152_c0_g1_i1.p1  ORF type:complete len:491 (+),score=78.29 TRINITY_DN7152_c0_g1_i1:64-1536(+)
MFLEAAQRFVVASRHKSRAAVLTHRRRIRPGRILRPGLDLFIRKVVHPIVHEYITELDDWLITCFVYFNTIILLTTAQLFQWVGTWNLLSSQDIWVWDEKVARGASYNILGFTIIYLSMRFFNLDKSYVQMDNAWKKGLPSSFGWKRKFTTFLRKQFLFIGYLLVTVGTWAILDELLFASTWERDLLYVVIPTIMLFILEEVFSNESLYLIAAKFGRNFKEQLRQEAMDGHYDPNSLLIPAQSLHHAGDLFVRDFIQPAVKPYISPCEDWAITIFNYINLVLIMTLLETMMWVGTWNLLYYYIWPESEDNIHTVVFVTVGVIVMFLSVRFFNPDQDYEDKEDTWQDGLPKSFGWWRKFKCYIRHIFSFLGFLSMWVGTWQPLDEIIEPSLMRDVMYVVLSTISLLFLEEFLSAESLYYMSSKYRDWYYWNYEYLDDEDDEEGVVEDKDDPNASVEKINTDDESAMRNHDIIIVSEPDNKSHSTVYTPLLK